MNKTPISALQELMAGRGHPLPVYSEEQRIAGPFTCTVQVAGLTVSGTSPTKKGAKHESAKNALEMLRVKMGGAGALVPVASPAISAPYRNYVGELNEFTSKRCLGYPAYESIMGNTLGEFYIKCTCMGEETVGKALNKKDAKQLAAKSMLELVAAINPARLVPVQPKQPTLDPVQRNQVIKRYQSLSINDTPISREVRSDELPAIPDVVYSKDDGIEELAAKLGEYGIKYTLRELQKSPCIMFLVIDGTNLTFGGGGRNREEATKEVLKSVIEIARTGVSLNTNDLLSLG